MSSYRAVRRGALPGTSDVTLGGVRLPAGTLVAPDASFASQPSPAPVLWITRQVVPEVGALWKEIAKGFAQHGLWPLVLESLRGADDRPWLAGELDPSQSESPDAHDPATFLQQQWSQVVPVPEEEPEAFAPLAPFGVEFPGLAAPSAGVADPTAPGDVGAQLSGRLGLVAITRPADALAAVGWSGPVNHYADMGALGAVLRSWEDRFGAYLVGVGFDTIVLGVERPIREKKHALAVAAEHFALCSDNVHQGAGSIEAYAENLVGERAWAFWWD